MLVNIGKTLNSRDSIFKGVIPCFPLSGAQKLHRGHGDGSRRLLPSLIEK
jgi:hypothetical protein